ncbi:MAG: patatin-like phospholipase family protein [Pyrinomonadaceae bacterium]
MRCRIVNVLLIVSLVINFSVPSVFGQDDAPRKRPTVGLVLSGGGARGFAHIGVLKVLEENRIPVDYVGGASMGALVGAMYAMGRTPDEIQQFVASLDWDKLFQTSTSFDHLSFRRKEDRRNIPAPVALKGKINDLKLPNALNSGQEIGLLIDRATLPYALVNDFNDLPIPFRAVGTDMVNGNSVPLKSGSLSRSLRATMSIPGVFSPVEVDGKILADGGLVNNIPTDVVKAMGADILLVVNIETELDGREALESLPGVLKQTINIATLDNSRRSLRQADFIIAPDLGDYSLSDFSDFQEIIKLGYQGAQQKVALLKGLALDEAQWQEHLARRRQRKLPETDPVPEFVAVEGNDADATRTIKEKLGDKYTGQPLDRARQDQLAQDLLDLKGTGRFETLDYDLARKEGRTGLIININKIAEKPSKPTRLELGVDVNSVESDNVNFNFLARLTFFDVGRYGAEWRNDLRLGSNTILATEYFRPLGKTKFFVAPRASYERRRANFFSAGNRLAEYVGQTVQAGVDLGYTFNARSELRAGYTIGYRNLSRRIGDPLLPDIKGRFSTAGLRWTYDGLDKAQVPNDGILTRNTLNYYFDSPDSDGHFIQAETRINVFRSVSERNILFGFGGVGATFGNTAPQIQKFTLGGPLRLGGYGYEELRADNYIQGGFGLLHNPGFFPSFLGGRAYLGAWYEGGSAFEQFNKANYRQSFTGGAIVETPFGPVFVGGSLNENGRGRFYFSYGRFF